MVKKIVKAILAGTLISSVTHLLIWCIVVLGAYSGCGSVKKSLIFPTHEGMGLCTATDTMNYPGVLLFALVILVAGSFVGLKWLKLVSLESVWWKLLIAVAINVTFLLLMFLFGEFYGGGDI